MLSLFERYGLWYNKRENYGLSLSDQYWIRPDHSKIQWKDINFFENLFSEDVGSALFGGPFSGNFMSPDNTSDGWLRKKWVIQNQKRVLLKSGSGESQQEPLNEVLANMICDRLKHCHSMSQNHSANIMRNRSL